MSGLFASTHNPDVLSCIANLSNDEVFTPPELVNQMLDMLPEELWSDPDATFLDPACKSGVFLREIAKRLIKGLADEIPDLEERLEHIYKKQLYGIACTELTSLLSRRSLYCSKWPNSKYSVVKFDNPKGNIDYLRLEHSWENGRCRFCGAAQREYDRDESLEQYAYEFIHLDNPEEVLPVKFDVIIGNPPYQMSDGGHGASAGPLYHRFVLQAKKLNPRYLVMIIPSRWFAGGKGLDEFRDSMLNDRRISHLVDYVNAKDLFPGISLGGGACYFLWDRGHSSDCLYTNIHDRVSSTQLRNLAEYPVFVRYNEARTIIDKVQKFCEPSVSTVVGSRNPFGLSSSERGESAAGEVTLHSSGGIGRISRDEVKAGMAILDHWKVMISKVTSEHAGEPDKSGMFSVLSTVKVLRPLEVCTDSYLIAFESEERVFAENFARYMHTKFFRFLLLLAVTSINLSKDKFMFVPMQDLSVTWTDADLYLKYGLTSEEISFIDSMIKNKDYSYGDSDE